MDAGPLRDLLTLLAGVVTGMLSGAFGVGGGVISKPAIRALGVSAVVAIGTTLPAVIPSAISGTLRYTRERLVVWGAVAWTAPVGIAVAVLGALLVPLVPGDGHLLQLVIAALLALTAWRIGRQAVRHARTAGGLVDPDPPADPRARYVAVGALAGLLAGLLGIGGGVVMVPGFNQLAGLRLKQAIATSLVCVGIFAVPATITHAVLGNIDWRFAILLAIGVIPGARVGASASVRATDQRLRLAVATFLGAVAVFYVVGELRGLLGS